MQIIWVALLSAVAPTSQVQIFHFIDNRLWGEVDGSGVAGEFSCGNIKCEMFTTTAKNPNDQFSDILDKFVRMSNNSAPGKKQITVSLYNIHTWGTLTRWPHKPATCVWPTDLTMAESEESFGRFKSLFQNSFPLFDGNSTTHPSSSVQRVYYAGKFKENAHLLHLNSFDSLIKGASFVASTCHRGRQVSNREEVVSALETLVRVDSLGKCHRTPTGPEGIVLRSSPNDEENLRLKRETIGKYMFYLAFENTIESGYVTEKVFDALIAGTVPIYLGSAGIHTRPKNLMTCASGSNSHSNIYPLRIFTLTNSNPHTHIRDHAKDECKKLIPFKDAVLYLADFGNDVNKLAKYMKYLIANETAYEQVRSNWRKISPSAVSSVQVKERNENSASYRLQSPQHYAHFTDALTAHSQYQLHPSMKYSWPCNICEWALRTVIKSDPSGGEAAPKEIRTRDVPYVPYYNTNLSEQEQYILEEKAVRIMAKKRADFRETFTQSVKLAIGSSHYTQSSNTMGSILGINNGHCQDLTLKPLRSYRTSSKS